MIRYLSPVLTAETVVSEGVIGNGELLVVDESFSL
jgi:hypothetical protein